MSSVELLTPLVGLLAGGGLAGAFVTVYKARPDRDAVIISSTQNATDILSTVNQRLVEEADRTRIRNEFLFSELQRCHEATMRGIPFDPRQPPH